MEPIIRPARRPASIMASAHTDRENNRYGMVRDLISEQDEINKRRSKALHLLSVKQAVMEDEARPRISTRRDARSRGRMGWPSSTPA